MFGLIENPQNCSPSFIKEWQELGQNALIANPFFDPDFLLPALKHLEKRPVKLAVLRNENNKLIALAPIIQTRIIGLGPAFISLWNHPYTPLTTPLIDKNHASAFEKLLLKIIDAVNMPLMINELKGFETSFQNQQSNLKSLLLDSHERAALETSLKGPDYRQKNLSKKSLQGLNRRYRRLREKTEPLGLLTLTFCEDSSFIPSRFEAFMQLEKKGWKGSGKTALLSKSQNTNFAREALANLSKRQMAAIATLQAGETILAALTLFKVGNHYFSWKTSFDEKYKSYSPGAQILARFCDPILEGGNIILDSCSTPDNQIANRIWAERTTIEKRLFYLPEQKDQAYKIKYLDTWKTKLKQKAKSILKMLHTA